MHIHKWSKWVFGEATWVNTSSGRKREGYAQMRKCEKCGKTQVQEV